MPIGPAIDVACTVRFTHVYPDGPAPYFTWHAFGEKSKLVEQFWAIKSAASGAMCDAGGTITHHHSLGPDHRKLYDQEVPPLFRDVIRATKNYSGPEVGAESRHSARPMTAPLADIRVLDFNRESSRALGARRCSRTWGRK